MPRTDAEQEGITLPPVSMYRLIAREEANSVMKEHLQLCPFAAEQVTARLRFVESRLWLLIGLMMGSGAIGGVSGAAITRILCP